MAAPRSRLLRLALLALALVVGLLALRRGLGLELDSDSLERAVASLGIWAPLAYVGIVAFRVPLGLPSQLVLMGGGLVFGTLEGTLFGALGILLSAVLLFAGARWAGREVVEERLPPRMRPVFDLAETRLGALFMAVGTGYPFGPITMYHLIAGVTGMALVVFVLAVSIGALMRSALFTYFGSRLVSGDLSGLAVACAAIGVVVIVPLCFSRSRAWLVQVGRGPTEPAPVPGGDEVDRPPIA